MIVKLVYFVAVKEQYVASSSRAVNWHIFTEANCALLTSR